MNNHTCPRCGRKAATKLIPLSGTSRGAMVCTDCYDYMTYSDEAYERFVYLERKKDESKKKEATEDQSMTNKQRRPTSWTEEEVAELIKKRSEGASIAECAQCLGRTPGAVSGKLWQLKDLGKIKEEDITDPVSEEKGELNPLEQEMSAIIEEQKEEIEQLKRENERLDKENEALLGKGIDLHNRASDLECELKCTKAALEDTERQFDEYRKETENAGADAILARYQQELERAEAEISRLTMALERANRIALGVVEKFALTEAV